MKEEIHQSSEDYLERILMLMESQGHVRSIDIAESMGFSKPSVSIAMKKLRKNGSIIMDDAGYISLTDKGYAIASKVYDRHKTLTKALILLGVDEETAKRDACLVEHVLSEETFQAIKAKVNGEGK